VVLFVYLLRKDPRRWVKVFAGAALAAVIVQGVLGGLRVTGRFTLSDSPADVSPSIALAVVHGVFGQVFFGMAVFLAAFTSRSWVTGPPAAEAPNAGTDRTASAVLVASLIGQLVLGALQRHMTEGLLVHVTGAAIVFLIALFVGMRAWALRADHEPLRKGGLWLMGLMLLQVGLGIAAWAAASATRDLPVRPDSDVLLTTAHQAVGALVLAAAVHVSAFSRRCVYGA
jgi:cytochrome c oxidase assembly protein subunit 15